MKHITCLIIQGAVAFILKRSCSYVVANADSETTGLTTLPDGSASESRLGHCRVFTRRPVVSFAIIRTCSDLNLKVVNIQSIMRRSNPIHCFHTDNLMSTFLYHFTSVRFRSTVLTFGNSVVIFRFRSCCGFLHPPVQLSIRRHHWRLAGDDNIGRQRVRTQH